MLISVLHSYKFFLRPGLRLLAANLDEFDMNSNSSAVVLRLPVIDAEGVHNDWRLS